MAVTTLTSTYSPLILSCAELERLLLLSLVPSISCVIVEKKGWKVWWHSEGHPQHHQDCRICDRLSYRSLLAVSTLIHSLLLLSLFLSCRWRTKGSREKKNKKKEGESESTFFLVLDTLLRSFPMLDCCLCFYFDAAGTRRPLIQKSWLRAVDNGPRSSPSFFLSLHVFFFSFQHAYYYYYYCCSIELPSHAAESLTLWLIAWTRVSLTDRWK